MPKHPITGTEPLRSRMAYYEAGVNVLKGLPPGDKTTTARVLMVVEYDKRPDHTEVKELVEKAREYGGTVIVVLETMAPSFEDLT